MSDDVNASDGGPDDLKAWRRHSVKLISSIIESASTAHQVRGGSRSSISRDRKDVRSGATGATLAEAKKINTSLLALGNCIAALTDASQKHVPFRDSVLTRLLQESFGGNCKTTLIVCCSPAEADLSETLSTLRFGARARKVRNFAKVNAVVDVTALAEQLQAPRLAESLQQQLTVKSSCCGRAVRAPRCMRRARCSSRSSCGWRGGRRRGCARSKELAAAERVRNYETTEAAEAAAAREAAAAKAARREASKAKAEAEAARGGGGAAEAPLRERAGRLKESEARADAERRAEAAAAAAAEKLRAGDAAHAATLAEHEVELMAATEAAAQKARAEAAAAVARRRRRRRRQRRGHPRGGEQHDQSGAGAAHGERSRASS